MAANPPPSGDQSARPSSTPAQSPVAASRQSALSATREPFVPPRQVLDQVDGRVLDPGTALSVKGVRPRSTVYVGPRLIISESADTATVIDRLEQVAAGLGWVVTIHHDDDEQGDESGDEYRAGQIPGVIRLDLTVRDQERASMAPDGWVLLQNARAQYGIPAMRHVGLDHIVLVRSIGAEPFHRHAPLPLHPRCRRCRLVGGRVVLRDRRQRRAASR